MVRAAAPFVMAWGLLGASPAAGIMVTGDEETDTKTKWLADLLSDSSFEEGLPAEFNTSRLRILADLQRGRPGSPAEDNGYDCNANPHMCKAPFHCDQWTHQDTMDVQMSGLATIDMHANLRTWCMPGLERYASTVLKECIAGRDLVKSAKSAFHSAFENWADELDASYCFAEGHCTFSLDATKNKNPTLPDMEKMCDRRFGGRKGWTKNFISSLHRLMDMTGVFNSLVSSKDGFKTQRITRVLSKMACAQGIFHCDIQYCKNTYCRDEYYVKKYSHLLPKVPGHLIEDPDITKEFLTHSKHHRIQHHF